jgi:four helix bundle protein
MQDLKDRYMRFAIENGVLIQMLPKSIINTAYSNQLIRSSNSPGTNYRAACRAKSPADFINKLKIVEEGLDESSYFLELIAHFNPDLKLPIDTLVRESNELIAITVSSIKTARLKLRTS